MARRTPALHSPSINQEKHYKTSGKHIIKIIPKKREDAYATKLNHEHPISNKAFSGHAWHYIYLKVAKYTLSVIT